MKRTATYSANDTWVCPGGVSRVLVKAWGGGGDGGDADAIAYNGGGGGGGAYSEGLIAVAAGNTYTLDIGRASDSIFRLISVVKIKAAFGQDGQPSYEPDGQGVGGAGGQVADCVGTTKYAGTNGTNNGVGGGAANGGGGGGGVGELGTAPGGGGGGGEKPAGAGSAGAEGWIILEWYYDNEMLNLIVNA